MAKRPYYVRCTNCGRRFDAGKIAPLNRSLAFSENGCLCRTCRNQLAKDRVNEINIAEASGEISSDKAYMLKHGKNYTKMIIGIIILIFVFIALPTAIRNHSSSLFGCIAGVLIGAGLLIWNIIEVKKYNQAMTNEKTRVQEEKDSSMGVTVCIHCGASSRGDICPYCGMDKHRGSE